MDNAKLRILYVDDEVDNLFTFKSMFRRFFAVTTAENGKEAQDLLEQKAFDVVLSDQRMPEMSGIELCTFISKQYPDVRRYIVTGNSEIQPINEAISEGIVGAVIRKPWEMSELKSMLQD